MIGDARITLKDKFHTHSIDRGNARKLTMGFGLLLVTAFAAIVSTADCYGSSVIYASTTRTLKFVTASAYDYYEFKIQPSPYSRSYYLEITWPSSEFDVTGNMPFCQEAYVEVFLTR